MGDKYVVPMILALVIWTVLCLIVGAEMRDGGWERAAIEATCAQYNPTTGLFEWINE